MEGNFKARCVDLNNGDKDLYTINKVYTITDGSLTYNDGYTTLETLKKRINNIRDLNNLLTPTFELVEEPKESEIDIEKLIIKYYLQKVTDEELLTEVERRLKKWVNY